MEKRAVIKTLPQVLKLIKEMKRGVGDGVSGNNDVAGEPDGE